MTVSPGSTRGGWAAAKRGETRKGMSKRIAGSPGVGSIPGDASNPTDAAVDQEGTGP